MEEIKIRVGLIGYGMAGEFFHAPLIHVTPGLQLRRVLERQKERSKERYPQVQVVRDLPALIDDDEINLVVIASPNNTHYDYAKRSLQAGKHVVIDKPFAILAKEAEELIKLAEERGRLLSVFQNRRWDGDFLTVQKLKNEGTLGTIQEYYAHYDRFRPEVNIASWKEREGILYDLGPHLIDQALVLFGEPRTVNVKIEKQRPNALAEDYFEIQLEYPSLKMFLSASMLMETPRPRFFLKGSTGTFIKYGLDPQESALKAGHWPEGEKWGEEAQDNGGILHVGQVQSRLISERGHYPAYYENICQAIKGQQPLAVTPKWPLLALKIIEQGRK